jgi:hypothetical protein
MGFKHLIIIKKRVKLEANIKPFKTGLLYHLIFKISLLQKACVNFEQG